MIGLAFDKDDLIGRYALQHVLLGLFRLPGSFCTFAKAQLVTLQGVVGFILPVLLPVFWGHKEAHYAGLVIVLC